jgi:hypothetical protein
MNQFPTKCTFLDGSVVEPINHDSLSIRNVTEIGVRATRAKFRLANCSGIISAIEDSDRVEERRKICPSHVEDASKYSGVHEHLTSACKQNSVSCTYELHTPCRADMSDDEPGNYNVSQSAGQSSPDSRFVPDRFINKNVMKYCLRCLRSLRWCHL